MLKVMLAIMAVEIIVILAVMLARKIRETNGDNIYDEREIHEHCTVEIWTNSKTGAQSFGWRREQ